MRVHIDIAPNGSDRVDIYVQSRDIAWEYLPGGQRNVITRKHFNDDIKPFLTLKMEEYEAIADAILKTSQPVLAEQATLAADVEDARSVRDRLLTLVEELVP